MQTITTYCPHYGPQGEPYRVRSRFGDRAVVSFHWTQQEALQARDEAFDAGAHTVHVSGLPMIAVVAGFPTVPGPLPNIED